MDTTVIGIDLLTQILLRVSGTFLLRLVSFGRRTPGIRDDLIEGFILLLQFLNLILQRYLLCSNAFQFLLVHLHTDGLFERNEILIERILIIIDKLALVGKRRMIIRHDFLQLFECSTTLFQREIAVIDNLR